MASSTTIKGPMTKPVDFYVVRHIARDDWKDKNRKHDINPSVTDAFTDGFWAARDWAVAQMLERFKHAPEHHDEIRRLLGKDADPCSTCGNSGSYSRGGDGPNCPECGGS